MTAITTEEYTSATAIPKTKAYTESYQLNNLKIFLRPRPYARHGGYFVLVPLLPRPIPLTPLPAEIWSRVIGMIIREEQAAMITTKRKAIESRRERERGGLGWRKGEGEKVREKEGQRRFNGWNLVLVCKDLKSIALPLLYAHCEIPTLQSLEKFTSHLALSDRKWDSLRRIPYSTPGRWVQSLNLCDLEVQSRTEGCTLDTLLTTLFPLLPFLARLELPLSVQLSARAMRVLGQRDGVENLRSLTGVKYDNTSAAQSSGSGAEISNLFSRLDSLALLISRCTGLEDLEVVGLGLDDFDTTTMITTTSAEAAVNQNLNSQYLLSTAHPNSQFQPPGPFLHLPRLRSLSLLATPSSALFHELTLTALPSLRHLVITPYGELPPPACLLLPFLAAHGEHIHSLVLHTPKSWPTVLFPPPRTLLTHLPSLTALSIETTGELALDLPFSSSPSALSSLASLSQRPSPLRHEHWPQPQPHPLTSLWIPRPTPPLRDALLIQLLPNLPCLREIRARDVRWARRGISARAQEAGSLGEMYLWRRLLGPKGVRMLDVDGREESIWT